MPSPVRRAFRFPTVAPRSPRRYGRGRDPPPSIAASRLPASWPPRPERLCLSTPALLRESAARRFTALTVGASIAPSPNLRPTHHPAAKHRGRNTASWSAEPVLSEAEGRKGRDFAPKVSAALRPRCWASRTEGGHVPERGAAPLSQDCFPLLQQEKGVRACPERSRGRDEVLDERQRAAAKSCVSGDGRAQSFEAKLGAGR